MLGQIFSALGGALGDACGGGMFSTIGRFAGRSLGNYIEQSNIQAEEYYRHRRHLDNLYIEATTEGRVIPIIYGYAKVQGHMIWALPLKEAMHEEATSKNFHGTDIERSIQHDTSYTYYASFALGICEGEITDISRAWAGGDLIDISKYKCRIYKGSKDQTPDPLIESAQGAGKTPAFRGLAYIVFEELPLKEFGNKVPHFSFEVQKKCGAEGVEDMVRSMVMIPGSGEFVYDTIIQQKITKSDGVTLMKVDINSHNHKNIADSLFSLDQLQSTCPNLEWVAPVVCWFGDNLNAGECSIVPRVEYNDKNSISSEVWKVAGYNRDTAKLVSRDDKGNPNYGGSVNDASVLRYLEELQRRNLKVMLYPMFFLDIPQKPWRGHLSGIPEDIDKFFNKPDGYKNFILHYARLVAGKVDAFVIGSELIGLTKINAASRFPAVDQLIDLAEKVKAILGPSTI
ncbi:MAG: glycoside hydrolase TIM-barrel-like domain-containing protein [Pseudomonadota bacterium]